MAFDAEFGNEHFPQTGETYAQLLPRAVHIEGLLTKLLEEPDWDITRLHFQAPFGIDHRIELDARTSTPALLTPDYWELAVRHDAEGMTGTALRVRFQDDSEEPFSVLYARDYLASVLGGEARTEQRFLDLVFNGVGLKTEPDNTGATEAVKLQGGALLMKGCAEYKRRTWRTLNDGTRVFLVTSSKEGEQPWPEIDADPASWIRVQESNRVVEFRRTRDGVYQTHEVIPDRKQELGSVVGQNMVVGEGEDAIEVNLGDTRDNRSKHGVIAAAETAMGMRDLDAERLDYVEEALTKVTAERKK
jgi:hypothetical protein